MIDPFRPALPVAAVLAAIALVSPALTAHPASSPQARRSVGGVSTQRGPSAAGSAVPAGKSAPAAQESLDYEYFKTKVQPIFLARRPGHARCIACHASGTPLRLQPLSAGSATWDEEQSRRNFEAVRRVAVPGSAKSPLLVHPLAEQAGGDFFHSGGKHWESQSDPEWQTLKAWVMR